LRVALDVLGTLARGPDIAIEPPTELSRLLLEYVQIGSDGSAHLAAAEGDTSGVLELIWSILAGHPTSQHPPPRLRDVVDEIPTDVDELLVNVLSPARTIATVAEFFEALEDACRGDVASTEDVSELIAEMRGAEPLAPASSLLKAILSVSTKPPAPRRSTTPEALVDSRRGATKPIAPNGRSSSDDRRKR
jgi:hypothetical protein